MVSFQNGTRRRKKIDFPQSSERAIESNILASSFQKIGGAGFPCLLHDSAKSWRVDFAAAHIFLAKFNYFNVARFITRSAND